jgi:hypothetical protein
LWDTPQADSLTKYRSVSAGANVNPAGSLAATGKLRKIWCYKLRRYAVSTASELELSLLLRISYCVLKCHCNILPVPPFLLLCLLALLAPAPLSANDSWPRFRGWDGNGISSATNVPIRWSEADVRWKAPLPGKGHSSPVIWKERVFVTSGDVTNADRYIICLVSADGRTLWRKKYGSRTFTQNRENSFGSASPTVDDAGVYLSGRPRKRLRSLA